MAGRAERSGAVPATHQHRLQTSALGRDGWPGRPPLRYGTPGHDDYVCWFSQRRWMHRRKIALEDLPGAGLMTAINPSDALTTTAQVSVALAGFTGVVAVFGSGTVHDLPPIDRYRLRLMVA